VNQTALTDEEHALALKALKGLLSRYEKQSVLAAELGSSQGTVSNIVNGRGRIGTHVAQGIARLCGVSPDVLLGRVPGDASPAAPPLAQRAEWAGAVAAARTRFGPALQDVALDAAGRIAGLPPLRLSAEFVLDLTTLLVKYAAPAESDAELQAQAAAELAAAQRAGAAMARPRRRAARG
jgi:hypothetical protein